jgi:hypothetical protein
MDGAYLRKSTASTATKIRICGVIASMTYDAANGKHPVNTIEARENGVGGPNGSACHED